MASISGYNAKIEHMIKFIEHETNEKIEEIMLKIEEEVEIESNRTKQGQSVRINEFYKKKQKQLEIKKKIQSSQIENNARIKILKAREDNVKNVLDETLERLAALTENTDEYMKLLEGLISQGLFQLLSAKVEIKCREKDLTLIQEVIPKVIETYESMSGRKVEITINKKFLSDGIAGGVELSADKGKVKVVNTLESRLELISEKELPEIREILFGKNNNRKFKD